MLIARNFIKGKEFLDPISIDNIDIMQDWIAEEENFLDKYDFDMDWETVEELLITSSKIVDDEEVVFDEYDEITILPNQSQWEWASTFEELENVNQ